MVGLTSTPLPRGDGTGKHDARHQRPGQLVEHEQLAAARRDGEPFVAEQAVELVGARGRRR